jgi:hypothetical protein
MAISLAEIIILCLIADWLFKAAKLLASWACSWWACSSALPSSRSSIQSSFPSALTSG